MSELPDRPQAGDDRVPLRPLRSCEDDVNGTAQPSFADRIIGARIVDVTQQGPTAGLWKIEFEHKGTDDDSGFLIIGLGSIYFNAEAES